MPLNLPKQDRSVPLRRGKHEVMAQRMAMGDNQATAFKVAGWNDAHPGSAASRLVKNNPEILDRAEYLRERMFDKQVESKLITKDELMMSLLETVKMARELEKPQLAVVHSCLRTIAEMNGHLIKKSEVKRMKDDPFGDASPQQLVNMIERAAGELGLEFDAQLLEQFVSGHPTDSGLPNGGDADEEAGLLQALPESGGIPQ